VIVGAVAILGVSVGFLIYSGNKVRQQLLQTSGSNKTAEDVGVFLKKWARVAGICLIVVAVTSAAAILLSNRARSISSMSCAFMQVIHSGLEVWLLGTWVHHVTHVLGKVPLTQLRRLPSAIPSSSTDSGRTVQVFATPQTPRHIVEPSKGQTECSQTQHSSLEQQKQDSKSDFAKPEDDPDLVENGVAPVRPSEPGLALQTISEDATIPAVAEVELQTIVTVP